MAQNPVTPINTLASTAPANIVPVKPAAANTTAEERAHNRSVSAAVQTVNTSGFAGDGREVTFSIDQATKRPVVKVVDTLTKEVIQQWPPEYLLQIAADAKKLTRNSG